MIDKLLSTAQAADLRGCTMSNIRFHLDADKQMIHNGRKCNFYLTSSVEALPAPHKVRGVRIKQPRKRYKTVKISLLDDPHGVMKCSKPTYRGRKCPGCGVPICTGKYKCNDCLAGNVGMRETEDIFYAYRR